MRNIPVKNMAIIDCYDKFFEYVYPIILNMSNKHKFLKDRLADAAVSQYALFHDAAKTNQKSKLYLLDSNIALVKEILRLMVSSRRKLLSRNQYEVASVLLRETGSMVGSWINRAKG